MDHEEKGGRGERDRRSEKGRGIRLAHLTYTGAPCLSR